MTDTYVLKLYKEGRAGDGELVLMERFDAPFTAEVLPMITAETGYGDYALIPGMKASDQ